MSLNGRLLFNGETFFIDAKPHVMRRLRGMFPSSCTTRYLGKFGKPVHTHRALKLSLTDSNCRDLDWIMSRFPLDAGKEVIQLIQEGSANHDQLYKDLESLQTNKSYRGSSKAWKFTLIPRDYQKVFYNIAKRVKKLLLADEMGLGKTFSAIMVMAQPSNGPRIVIAPTNLTLQWGSVLSEIAPECNWHIAKGVKPYKLPENLDVVITTYGRLKAWQDTFVPMGFKTVILEECQDLRKLGTIKREQSAVLCERADNVIGLSGTPIYNYGSEIWSILDVIKPGCLGNLGEFTSEWCAGYNDKVSNTVELNQYLISQGLMVRREAKQVGMKKVLQKQVVPVEPDTKGLEEVENVAKQLALSLLSGEVTETAAASSELDWKLRKATGIAKIRPTAEFVRMLLGQVDKVIVTMWHRDVYDRMNNLLKEFNPVMISGSESPAEKDRNKKRFIEDNNCKLLYLSLRSGAGLDGLQKVCKTIVHLELDWSPQIHAQLNDRIDRFGQEASVCNAYYMTTNYGSDPTVMAALDTKLSQHRGIIEGKDEAEIVVEDPAEQQSRARQMAIDYLKSIGEEVPESFEAVGLLAEVTELLNRVRLPNNNEDAMQESLHEIMKDNLNATVEREYRISKRSRVDFKVSREDEVVLIECKINSTQRQSVYNQVRRYVKEEPGASYVLIAPWPGVTKFKVDGTPVTVINTSKNSL